MVHGESVAFSDTALETHAARSFRLIRVTHFLILHFRPLPLRRSVAIVLKICMNKPQQSSPNWIWVSASPEVTPMSILEACVSNDGQVTAEVYSNFS